MANHLKKQLDITRPSARSSGLFAPSNSSYKRKRLSGTHQQLRSIYEDGIQLVQKTQAIAVDTFNQDFPDTALLQPFAPSVKPATSPFLAQPHQEAPFDPSKSLPGFAVAAKSQLCGMKSNIGAVYQKTLANFQVAMANSTPTELQQKALNAFAVLDAINNANSQLTMLHKRLDELSDPCLLARQLDLLIENRITVPCQFLIQTIEQYASTSDYPHLITACHQLSIFIQSVLIELSNDFAAENYAAIKSTTPTASAGS